MNKTVSKLFLLSLLIIASCIHRKAEMTIWEYKVSEQKILQLSRQLEEHRIRANTLKFEIQQLEKQGEYQEEIKTLLKDHTELSEKINIIEQLLIGACRGYMKISSNPQKAKIRIDGDKQEALTPALFRAPCGSYSVKVEKNGYKYNNNARNVIVIENDTTFAHFESQ